MPDPTLSGSAAEFLAIFAQVHGDKAWKLFEELARNGLTVPGPNNAALNPVLTDAKKATIAGVDYITYADRKGPRSSRFSTKEERRRPAADFVQQTNRT